MSPSAVTPPQSTAELTNAGVKHDIEHSAPSMSTNGSSNLHELDASKLIFTRNPDPRPLPESNSPEVWAQNVYVPLRDTLLPSILDALSLDAPTT